MSRIIRRDSNVGRLAITLEIGERCRILCADGREVWVSLIETRRAKAKLVFAADRCIDIAREKIIEQRKSPAT